MIDNGSYEIKIGYAGTEVTSLKLVPSLVGRPNYRRCFPTTDAHEKVFVGAEAEEHRGILRLSCPIQGGVPADIDDCQRLWRHAYSSLGARSDAQAAIITEPILQPSASRRRIAEIFFESMQTPELFFAPAPVLALYPTSNVTGLVVDVGHAHAQAVPVVDGYAIASAAIRSDAAGGAVASEHLLALLRDDGHAFTTSAEMRTVDAIKEQMCFVPDAPAASLAAARLGRIPPPSSDLVDRRDGSAEATFALPDGTTISIGEHALSAPVALLHPAVCGYEAPGAAEVAAAALARAPLDTRAALAGGIHLAGGSTLAKNFPAAFRKALRASPVGRSNSATVYTLGERRYSAWLGGGILASLSSFRKLWVTAAVRRVHV